MYADGDVGDVNHEGHVLRVLTHSILESFGVFEDEPDELAAYAEQVCEAMGLEVGEDGAELPSIETLFASDQLKANWPDDARRRAALTCVLGNGDARDYALQYDGWKRVKGTSVETWALSASDLDAIVDGIYDAVGFEADKEIGEDRFDIDVRITRTFYESVPWVVLSTKRLGALRDYARTY